MADETQLTIYSTAPAGTLTVENFVNEGAHIPGYAMVKQDRLIPIKKGQFSYAFSDVAALIDPTTVTFSIPEAAEAATVIEQNFQFDLVSSNQLLNKYIDQHIKVSFSNAKESKEIAGILLSAKGGLVLQTDDGKIVTLNQWTHITYPSLPGGLLSKPTLIWQLNGTEKAQHKARVTYQTQGLTWWTDYNLLLKNDNSKCQFDMSAWVTIVNQSGTAYEQAKLKLIAGDVNRIQPAPQPRAMMRESLAQTQVEVGFEEKSFFEYHMYTLGRMIDVPNRSTKQLELMPKAFNVACQKQLVYNPSNHFNQRYNRPIVDKGYMANSSSKVEALLTFVNSSAEGMGVALPAGRIRVNQIDGNDQSIEFIGEDKIDHTPKNKKVSIKLGRSFDVTAERKQTEFTLLNSRLTETFEIELDNQKEHDQIVLVKESLYRWSNWEIIQSSHQFKKINASTIQFDVELNPESKSILRYTVRYDWPEKFSK